MTWHSWPVRRPLVGRYRPLCRGAARRGRVSALCSATRAVRRYASLNRVGWDAHDDARRSFPLGLCGARRSMEMLTTAPTTLVVLESRAVARRRRCHSGYATRRVRATAGRLGCPASMPVLTTAPRFSTGACFGVPREGVLSARGCESAAAYWRRLRGELAAPRTYDVEAKGEAWSRLWRYVFLGATVVGV